MTTFEPVITADGSLSCLDSETGELCHNRAGAYTEALNNYIHPSELSEILLKQGRVNILDACYGLGYNTWALINELLKMKPSELHAVKERHGQCTISVIAIERHPEVLQFLPSVLEHPTFDNLKNKITPLEHNAYYRTLLSEKYTKGRSAEKQLFVIEVANGWRIEIDLRVGDLREEVPRLSQNFDAIFHDPFSPQKMPELWTVDLFRHYFRLLKERNGRLLTYCAAAAVRGGLEEAGFRIAKTQGLGAKSGGTIAFAGSDSLNHMNRPEISQPLAGWEMEYLASRAGLPYRDSGLCQSREQILQNRQAEQATSSRPSGGAALKKKASEP